MEWMHIFKSGDMVLITTFVLLISMSLASWSVILWKWWVLRKESQYLELFRKNVAVSSDWPLEHKSIQTQGSANILVQEAGRMALSLQNQPEEIRKELLSMHLTQALDRIRVFLDQGLTLLASVGSSAPFIGLFGTVWGIYGALIEISAKGNAGLNVVAGPMGEALVATAVGLFAAIPAVLAYNAFVRSNRLLVQDLRHIAEQLAFYLSLNQDTLGASLKSVSKGVKR